VVEGIHRTVRCGGRMRRKKGKKKRYHSVLPRIEKVRFERALLPSVSMHRKKKGGKKKGNHNFQQCHRAERVEEKGGAASSSPGTRKRGGKGKRNSAVSSREKAGRANSGRRAARQRHGRRLRRSREREGKEKGKESLPPASFLLRVERAKGKRWATFTETRPVVPPPGKNQKTRTPSFTDVHQKKGGKKGEKKGGGQPSST